jgi:hypothetical protein
MDAKDRAGGEGGREGGTRWIDRASMWNAGAGERKPSCRVVGEGDEKKGEGESVVSNAFLRAIS